MVYSHYEINVSLNGRHFFGTHERSCRSEDDVKVVLGTLKEKFPESEGYKVTCSGHVQYSQEVKF